jgi:hypothetical protein
MARQRASSIDATVSSPSLLLRHLLMAQRPDAQSLVPVPVTQSGEYPCAACEK